MAEVVVSGKPVGGEPQQQPTKPFRLREGVRHFQEGREVSAGETVYLTENQAKAFRDRFVAADSSGFKVQPSTPPINVNEDAAKLAQTSRQQPSQEEQRAQEALAQSQQTTSGATDKVKTEDDARHTVKADPEGTAKKV